jgi:hypothetical protein
MCTCHSSQPRLSCAPVAALKHIFNELHYEMTRKIADGGKGTWVRLLSEPVEGKLVQGFKGLDVGDQIKVQLKSVDVQRGFIDFRKVNSSRH